MQTVQNIFFWLMRKFGYYVSRDNTLEFFSLSKRSHHIEGLFKVSPKLNISRDEDGMCITVGFLYRFYIRIYNPWKWLTFGINDNSHTGFYFYDWAFVFSWNAPLHSGRYNLKWYEKWKDIYFHIDEFFLGTKKFTKDDILSTDCIYFVFRGQMYKTSKVKVFSRNYFWTRIPYAIYNKRYVTSEIKLDNPPMYAGKGENSYDLDDNATYSSSQLYEGPHPTYKNSDEVYKFIVHSYCMDIQKQISRYGRADKDSFNKHGDLNELFIYLGTFRTMGELIKKDVRLYHLSQEMLVRENSKKTSKEPTSSEVAESYPEGYGL